MIKININNSVKFNYQPYEKLIHQLVNTAIKLEKIKENKFEEIIIDISFVGNTKIRSMNNKYRYIDKITDVLSFPIDDLKKSNFPIVSLGDIYVSIDRAKKQCSEYNHSFKRELIFLICHGLLHLLGYDHILEEDEAIMLKKQAKIMKKIGVKRK